MNTTSDSDSDINFDDVYSGVLTSFVVILCGYVAGSFKLIAQNEAKGIGTFVGTFCLPALIFTSLAKLDLHSVNWWFLLAIFSAKAIVFFIVMIISRLVLRAEGLGKAGLFAILCTQSNDFAVGYPIVESLYNVSHPDYPHYLYLIAPVNLVILNPFGFLCLEMEKEREGNHQTRSRVMLALRISKSILCNPVVFTTILGIIANIAFSHCLPSLLDRILEVFGTAFIATALFLLGLRMVGNVRNNDTSQLLVVGVVVAVKIFILPVLTQEIVHLINPGQQSNETMDLSNFGFLYGTFPMAPAVYVYATHYNVAVDLVARALVACTFLSAPIMIVSAKMISLVSLSPSDFVSGLDNFIFDVAFFGLIGALWVVIAYIFSRKWKQIPHFMTVQLLLAQCLVCVGGIVWSVVTLDSIWKTQLQFAILAFGVYSSRIWTAVLAVSIVLLQCRSLCFTLRIRSALLLCGWGIPIGLVSFLIVVVGNEVLPGKQQPVFQYGHTQAIVSMGLLVASFIVTISCLIIQQRYIQRYVNSHEDVRGVIDDTVEAHSSNNENEIDVPDIEDLIPKEQNEHTRSVPIATTCAPEMSCDVEQQKECTFLVRDYRASLTSARGRPENSWDDNERLRHTAFFILLCFSMMVGIAICLWTLLLQEMSGIYVELMFFDAALNFGQGMFAFFLFGFDRQIVEFLHR